MAKAIYLGDGAYATLSGDGDMVITAGSHVIEEASDRVFLEPSGIAKLRAFIDNPALGDDVEP
jgi:hypothetical protein